MSRTFSTTALTFSIMLHSQRVDRKAGCLSTTDKRFINDKSTDIIIYESDIEAIAEIGGPENGARDNLGLSFYSFVRQLSDVQVCTHMSQYQIICICSFL